MPLSLDDLLTPKGGNGATISPERESKDEPRDDTRPDDHDDAAAGGQPPAANASRHQASDHAVPDQDASPPDNHSPAQAGSDAPAAEEARATASQTATSEAGASTEAAGEEVQSSDGGAGDEPIVIPDDGAWEEAIGPTSSAAENAATSNSSSANADLPKIVETLVESPPASLRGEARLHYLADQVLSVLEKDRYAMQSIIEGIVRRMVKLDASDVDMGGMGCNRQIWYRVDGDKRPREAAGQFTVDQTDVLFLNLLTEKQIKHLFENYSLDFSYSLPKEDPDGPDDRPLRFRASMYFDYDHLALNMRAISDEVFELEQIGFPEPIKKGLMFAHVRDGLTLITGVTGSGKSTTLDAVINANNKDVPAHVVVVGKPIEYMHRSKKCIVRHREVGKDVRTFKEGIVQALRQDPDIVVVGEMRDPDTISAALEITDSGHKVFSTLHTSSAMETIDRIVAEYPTDEQNRVRIRLADVLRCVVSQKLLPKVGGGRVLAKEILWLTPSAKAAIKNENVGELYQMMWESSREGMNTLEQDLFRLLRKREITMETAMDFANNKRRMQQLVR